ncbi:MAG TPA: hypothetical protein VGD26_09570 [Chitinophagaceae bacterium]
MTENDILETGETSQHPGHTIVPPRKRDIGCPPGAKVRKLYSQCGMSYVCDLGNSPDLKQQIATLDWAFNHVPEGEWSYGSPGSKDIKSQIIFTDTIETEKTRWPEIKKISIRGPVTWNERYKEGDPHRKQIAVYILTRDAYYAWKERMFPTTVKQRFKNLVSKLPENVRALHEKINKRAERVEFF